MSVVRFRKYKQTPEMLRRPTREMTFVPGASRGDELTGYASESDDFDEEVQLTRDNDALMEFLEERATEPATVSLRDLKRQLSDC